MRIEESQLKKFIIDTGLVSRRDVALAEAQADTDEGSLVDVLIKSGKLSADDVRRAWAHALGVPFIDLKGRAILFDTLCIVPEPISRAHNIVSFNKTPEAIEVAVLDLDDLASIDFIRKNSTVKVSPYFSDSNSITSALLQYQKGLKTEFGDVIKSETGGNGSMSGSGVDSLPSTRAIDALIKHALLQRATDIYIEPMEKEVLVRYRIDGIVHDAMVLPKESGFPLASRIKGLAGLKTGETRIPQAGGFKVDMNGEKVSLRVSTLPIIHGEKTVLRVLREEAHGMGLESLGFHGNGLELVHDAIKQQSGLIVTAGPIDSGRTTALYAMIEAIHSPQVSVSTIEETIKRHIPRASQTQVNQGIGLTFAVGLRSIIKQRPDVIMLGEVLDAETASVAANAALIGHRVFTSIHGESAAGALSRLISLDTDSETHISSFASTLSLVVGQRLVRKLDDGAERRPLAKSELAALEKIVNLDRILKMLREERVVGAKDGWEKVHFGVLKKSDLKSKKPEKSMTDGFKGRIGIHEVLKISPAMRDFIAKRASEAEIQTQARREGMTTMLEDGIFMAARGLTTVEEVLRVVSE